MKTSEQLDKIAPALVKAQGEIETVAKSGEGNRGKKYMTLDALLMAIKPVLYDHELALLQSVTGEDTRGIGVTTRIIHSSGQWMEDTSLFPLDDSGGKALVQGAGSSITYQRRYAVAAFFGIVSDEDTDGNAPGVKKPASNGNQRQPVSKPAPQGNQGPDPSNYVDTASPKFLSFMIRGREQYGTNWDTKRAELCEAVTKGRTRSSKELYPAEFAKLDKGVTGAA